MEARLAFFLKHGRPTSGNARQQLFNLKDCHSRIRFFQDLPGDHSDQVLGFEKTSTPSASNVTNPGSPLTKPTRTSFDACAWKMPAKDVFVLGIA